MECEERNEGAHKSQSVRGGAWPLALHLGAFLVLDRPRKRTQLPRPDGSDSPTDLARRRARTRR
jgi:hypothetical protein